MLFQQLYKYLIVNMANTNIKHLFFDIGGVILTNGWDRDHRIATAERFGLTVSTLQTRHYSLAGDFETGRVRLEEYLDRVVFYKPRDFSRQDFIEAMQQSTAVIPGRVEVLQELKDQGHCQMYSLNNESFDLNMYRIEHFGLRNYIHHFFSSCFLGAKKPDELIFERVKNITQFDPQTCLFIDDRKANTEAAERCGFNVFHLNEGMDLREGLIERGVLRI